MTTKAHAHESRYKGWCVVIGQAISAVGAILEHTNTRTHTYAALVFPLKLSPLFHRTVWSDDQLPPLRGGRLHQPQGRAWGPNGPVRLCPGHCHQPTPEVRGTHGQHPGEAREKGEQAPQSIDSPTLSGGGRKGALVLVAHST